MSRSAHPAGPRHADVLPEGHYSAPPADLNALDPKVWAQTVTRDEHGVATAGGISVTRLAEEFGTPAYVDEADFRSRARAWRTAFGTDADVYYAGKAFLSRAVVRWLHEELLRESLAGDKINRVMGIVNGTTNFILDKMDSTGAGYQEALDEATALGYAEADPTADVEGFDAAAKAAILAGIAFHTRVRLDDVYREGMTEVTAADFASAKEMGCTIKLLAICERAADGASVTARVHPAMIPLSHPLASVRGAYNAVFVESDAAGQLMFYGPGAGGSPTASAVLGDLVAVCRNRLSGATGPGESAYAALTVSPMGDVVTRYHISLDVADKPGVLAQVATVFAEHGVSIDTVRQSGKDGEASLVVVTHRASDAALTGTVEALRKLDTVRGVASIMRVEGE
ncbi:Diaminopimelate decarboxylase [Streptomyces violarus]